jgi:hypothetical protein
MGKRGALIACLVLAVLAGGGLAVLAVRDGGEEPSVGRPETNVGVETSTVPPRDESAGPIRFVLADRYVAGATVDVLIENVGTRAYVYQWPYQACFLRYFRRLGAAIHHPSRHALRPAQPETIRPGERKKVFTWSLDECVKDDWGCVESRPLPPGTYTIKGRFKPRSSGTPARAESTFTIVAA